MTVAQRLRMPEARKGAIPRERISLGFGRGGVKHEEKAGGRPEPLWRREILALIGGAAAAWPDIVRAADTVPRVSFPAIGFGSDTTGFDAIRDELRILGQIDGRSYQPEYRMSDDAVQFSGIAQDVVPRSRRHRPPRRSHRACEPADDEPAAVDHRRSTREAHPIPAIHSFAFEVEEGALAAYGPEPAESFQRAAQYVDRLLRGAKVADLPFDVPRTILLSLNQRTARALGLTIPPTLLAMADKIIE